MFPMFEKEVVPAFELDPSNTVRVRTVPTFGLGESAVADLLGPMMDRARNPLVGTTASGCIVTCRVRYTGHADGADAALDATVADLKARLGPAILTEHDAHDDGQVLVRTVTDLLRARSQTLAVVESCTGGLLGEMVTRLPGSSDVFAGGLLTYSNDLKTRLAGVDTALLTAHGAVSRVVALAMAQGGLDRTGATHALAITGIAGPGGGTDTKPVGTVWIARASADGSSDARRFLFKGGRDAIRLWAATTALGMLRLRLIDQRMHRCWVRLSPRLTELTLHRYALAATASPVDKSERARKSRTRSPAFVESVDRDQARRRRPNSPIATSPRLAAGRRGRDGQPVREKKVESTTM
jgi:nicotinamide-nucleotide amidase